MALTAAVTIGVRADAGEIRQRAAFAAIQGLAEKLKRLSLAPVPVYHLQMQVSHRLSAQRASIEHG